jgi:hypothetical protein
MDLPDGHKWQSKTQKETSAKVIVIVAVVCDRRDSSTESLGSVLTERLYRGLKN